MRYVFYIITIFSVCLTLVSCGLIPVYQVKIQQGNAITQKMVNKLHPGMTKNQVKSILGTPMLVNTFGDDTFYYVYTYQTGHTKIAEKHLTLFFRGGVLVSYKASGIKHPEYIRTPYHRRWY